MNMRTVFDAPAQRRRSFRRLFLRTPMRFLSIGRLFRGGRVNDPGRLPRYLSFFLLGVAGIWAPIAAYLVSAPLRYTSEVALILPGAGASASVNLSEIGQASSFANSPYANSSVSPTVTYKRLLTAGRVLAASAALTGEEPRAFGKPRIKLIDQTGLILIEMAGASAEEAQSRAAALTDAFMAELNLLRRDEQGRREASGTAAIRDYEDAVARTRDQITRLQTETGLVSIEQYRRVVSDADALEARLRDVEASLSQREGAVNAMAHTLGVDSADAALALRLHADPEFRALAEAMAAGAAELGIARGKYGENHPAVIAARAAFAGARTRLMERAEAVTGLDREESLRRVELLKEGNRAGLLSELVRLSTERDGLFAERRAISRSLDVLRGRIFALVDTAARLDELNRDYQVAEAVFASAIARSNTTKADIYASYPLVQVLEEASLPDAPSSPKRILALAAGIAGVFCLFVGLLLAWLRRPLIDRLTGRIEESDA